LPTAYPADSRKSVCEVCNNAIIANYHELERHNWQQKHSDKTKELFACHNVTQSFKLQRPDLERCSAEAICSDCLSLSIVLLHTNMQPFERDRQELCVIKKRGKFW